MAVIVETTYVYTTPRIHTHTHIYVRARVSCRHNVCTVCLPAATVAGLGETRFELFMMRGLYQHAYRRNARRTCTRENRSVSVPRRFILILAYFPSMFYARPFRVCRAPIIRRSFREQQIIITGLGRVSPIISLKNNFTRARRPGNALLGSPLRVGVSGFGGGFFLVKSAN